MIYLDNAATTFPKPEIVYRAVNDTQRSLAVNVGRGGYSLASKAAGVVDETRARLASFVGAYGPQCVVFTPSATLAANEIILGLEWDSLKNVYLTPFEHNAIARPLYKVCQENGLKERFIAFDPCSHRWDKDETERLFLSSPPDYVFLNHISNVTGTILPVEQIAELAKSYGATVIVDGSQSVGLIDYHLKNTSIDYLIFAGHKNLYSSFGVGGWISNGENKLQAFLAGGTGSDSLNLSMSNQQPIGYEPGSPNIIAISSLNASLKWLQETGQDTIANSKGRLLERLISGLSSLPVKAYADSQVLLTKLQNWKSFLSSAQDLPQTMKKKLQDRIEEADKQLNAHLQAIQEAIDNIFASAKNSKSLQDLMEAEKRLESITSFAPQESVLSDAAKMTESIHRVQTVVSELPNQIDQLTNYRCPIQIGFTSVIKAECQRKLNEFLKKQADWVKQYISPVEYEVRTMNAPRCSAWLSQTQTLPNYLDHQTVKRYHEVRRSVEQRLHSCRVQGVVSMFNELSNEEKEECLKILQKTT